MEETNYVDQHRRRTLLFVDEIHRFNKGQQDALLPFVESGLVTFIGATTENPFVRGQFGAVVARAGLRPGVAVRTELRELWSVRTRSRCRIYRSTKRRLPRLVGYADGDARRFLNLLEQAATAAESSGTRVVDGPLVESALSMNARRFDKGGQLLRPDLGAAQIGTRIAP